MSAAALAPPSAEVVAVDLPAKVFSMMSSSSESALGCTPSSVAMRMSTSARRPAGSSAMISAAWSESR